MPDPYFSAKESLCATCGSIFTSVSGFDSHLKPLPGGGCRDPSLVVDKLGRALLVEKHRRNPDGTPRAVWSQTRPDGAPRTYPPSSPGTLGGGSL